jgi:hypothetical protein
LLVRIDLVVTAIFVLTSAAAVVSDTFLRIVAVVVALVMFAAGSIAYLVGYGQAVQRSRTVEISMAGLVFLKSSAPERVRRLVGGATLVQVVVALVAASVRPFTTLAFGILAPMFGIGIQAWWAARYGSFPSRPQRRTAVRRGQRGNAGRGPARRGAR